MADGAEIQEEAGAAREPHLRCGGEGAAWAEGEGEGG